ncbi:hypothetical protein NLJ89_g7854 [Agrocybe chaxingu]|uniref:Protein kinase domain-containing protein n=1 Tax=Agrocybe chaxingu TaxID=84603 RepID=A0A9W8JWJ4_9AGAR|nr:hypothetical protein NLJ89_g7854 [Agrocybe chaxingu]
MDPSAIWKIFEHNPDALRTLAATSERAGHVFWKTEATHEPSQRQRQLDVLSSAYDSVFSLFNEVNKLQVAQILQGQGISEEMIERLNEIELGDLTSARGGDIRRLLLKLCLNREAEAINQHGERILEGGKVVLDLLVSQPRKSSRAMLAVSPADQHTARQISQDTGLEDLTDCILRERREFIAGGSFGEVYRAELIRGETRKKVAVKVIKIYEIDMEDPARKSRIENRLRREITVWKRLCHPNIVPLLGFVRSFQTGYYTSPLLSMVCPWMSDGSLTKYLQARNQHLTLRHRFQLLTDVIEGLTYLHSNSVIHGDLSSSNVLISENSASLSDFGLSQVVSEFVGTPYMTSKVAEAGAIRWKAPELFVGDDRRLTKAKACDIYSFGCIVHEVISGYLPYFDIENDYQVMIQKMTHIPPARPASGLLTNEIWDFIQLCWREEPNWRPEAMQVGRKLQVISSGYSNEALNAAFPSMLEESGLEVD